MLLKAHATVALRVALVFFLGGCACAQQPTPQPTPIEAARQRLEDYRKSRAPVWMSDFGELGRYRDADGSLPAPAPGENRVVFMGDSITDMWPLAEYFPGKSYVDRGIGGQTTPQMLIRFRQDVIDLSPKVVVILAGTNDIAGNTGPMRLEDTEANYASMAELAKAHGIRVVFSSVTPIYGDSPRAEALFLQRSPEKILELNRWLKDYCEKSGFLYLDYFGAMVDEKGFLKRDLSEDGLHPNPAGFRIMAPLAETAIQKALQRP